MSDDKTTHFGYDTVAIEDKASKVADVFHSVAAKYDVMNDRYDTMDDWRGVTEDQHDVMGGRVRRHHRSAGQESPPPL